MSPTAMLLHLVIGFPLGLFFANGVEWVMHKYVLHGLGRQRKTFWSFHWHEHHSASRKHDMYDPDYERVLSGWNGQTKEIAALAGGVVLQLPLFLLVPGFALGTVYSAFNYYRVHRRAHLDPAWARTHLPWHLDHHMGPNQDCNWCVTRPWFDHILGTRVPYVGTELEARRKERRASAVEQRLAHVSARELEQAPVNA